MNMVHRDTWYQEEEREKEEEIRRLEADGLRGYTAEDHSIWGPPKERYSDIYDDDPHKIAFASFCAVTRNQR